MNMYEHPWRQREQRMGTAAHRRERILERAEEKAFVEVGELAEELGCSQMTIRRDLGHLEAQGLVERSRGGASAE